MEIGRILITVGILIALAGVVLSMFGRVPFLGRLPGDIHIERENFRFYFPIVTGILISLLLTAIFWIFSRFR